MFKYFKLMTTSFVVLSCASFAQAGTITKSKMSVSTPSSVTQTYSAASYKAKAHYTTKRNKTRTKRVVRKVKALPNVRKAVTHSTRTVLYYEPEPTRSKIIRVKPSATSTPNLFSK